MVDMSFDGIQVEQFRWQQSAACNGVPSYVFFPDEVIKPGFKPDPQWRNKTASDYCPKCPVKYQCLEFALLHDMHGIWGGLSEKQREHKISPDERWGMREYREEQGRYAPLYGHS